MKQIVSAEFNPSEFRRSIGISRLNAERINIPTCQHYCPRGVFVSEQWDIETVAGNAPSDQNKTPFGVAYLDVLFQENPKVISPTLTDLTGEGNCLEITVVYPISYLAWFESILTEIKSENFVLGFVGCIEDAAEGSHLKPDPLGRLSDGFFETVSLTKKTPQIAPLSKEQRKRLIGVDS